MRQSTRIFLLAIFLIILLASGAGYLFWALSEPEAKRRVLEVFGGAIGAIAGALLFLAALLRMKGR